MFFRLKRCKSTKKFKIFKIFRQDSAKFGHIRDFLYLCSVKRIAYILPVKHIRGNISGRQDLNYDGADAYSIADDDAVSAANYQARVIAKVLGVGTRFALPYFQVRTRTTVNMTPAMRRNLALMGGSGALFASLMSDKSTAIYTACKAATPKGWTMRAYICPIIRNALAAKMSDITIADGVTIVNPWVSSATPNVPVRPEIIDKFNSELSNT